MYRNKIFEIKQKSKTHNCIQIRFTPIWCDSYYIPLQFCGEYNAKSRKVNWILIKFPLASLVYRVLKESWNIDTLWFSSLATCQLKAWLSRMLTLHLDKKQTNTYEEFKRKLAFLFLYTTNCLNFSCVRLIDFLTQIRNSILGNNNNSMDSRFT